MICLNWYETLILRFRLWRYQRRIDEDLVAWTLRHGHTSFDDYEWPARLPERVIVWSLTLMQPYVGLKPMSMSMAKSILRVSCNGHHIGRALGREAARSMVLRCMMLHRIVYQLD